MHVKFTSTLTIIQVLCTIALDLQGNADSLLSFRKNDWCWLRQLSFLTSWVELGVNTVFLICCDTIIKNVISQFVISIPVYWQICSVSKFRFGLDISHVKKKKSYVFSVCIGSDMFKIMCILLMKVLLHKNQF